ncbi:hypothetical protein [Pedobacter nutrimenti]|uniref:hypothetical protein n=1 Tax=Pedobacter nutrimenti TaxID=1241337 RepID=UPI00292CCDDB|nr:hypothetical protein [Pedobacter nutrimenti]
MTVAAAAVMLLYSCKRAESMDSDFQGPPSASAALSTKIAADEVSVLNGWLRFPSKDAFASVMKVLHGQYANGEKLAGWESQYSKRGFTSLRKLYEQIDADTTEYRRMPTVDSLIKTGKILDCPDSWFATVLSKDGLIQIADTVYSFKPGKEKGDGIAIPARHAGVIVRGGDFSSLQGAVLHETSFRWGPMFRWPDEEPIPGPTGLPICQYPSGFMPNWWGQKGKDVYASNNGIVFPEHNGRQVKLNYHRWRVGYIFYASAGVRVKMWKHTRFAGWQSVTYADEMLIEACCKGKVIIPGFPLIPFNEQTSPGWPMFARYAENNFEKTMKWTATGLFNEIWLDHFNFHFKVNYRGRIVERDIRE